MCRITSFAILKYAVVKKDKYEGLTLSSAACNYEGKNELELLCIKLATLVIDGRFPFPLSHHPERYPRR
jgi:hypothetical protein